MGFDEYEYLEKMVEDAEIRQEKDHSRKRRDVGGDGEGPAPRKSRAEEQNGERSDRDDREKERRKTKHYRQQRSSRDGERERDRDRDLRSRERDRKGEKEREREGDKDREGSRRSSSRSRREREAEREIERARSRERREQEFEKEIRERESRRFKEKKELTEPEADPERDQRTVFAYQMPLKATERDVYEFFSQVGKVRDVRLIMDRNSRRSKGVGYIEFYDVMTVPQAIALSGQLLLGQPLMVKPSEAEKNLVQSNTTGAGAAGAAAERKLYVGNLHFNITEGQLRQIFEPFGAVELVQLPLDLETGHCRGYGFVQFAQVEHAKAAQSLNGNLDIAGRVLKISAVTDHVGVQDSGANSADFADEDGAGLSLNARSRAILMRKLDRTGATASIAESLGVPVLNGAVPDQQAPSLPINGQTVVPAVFPAQRASSIEDHMEPSNCLLLKNMFDPGTETEPDFDLDIKEDVHEECSKFGHVKHIYVDKNSNGCVYLQFDTLAAAAGCQRAMHGRWFAGRSISATFMRPREYETRLGRAA